MNIISPELPPPAMIFELNSPPEAIVQARLKISNFGLSLISSIPSRFHDVRFRFPPVFASNDIRSSALPFKIVGRFKWNVNACPAVEDASMRENAVAFVAIGRLVAISGARIVILLD